MESFIVQRSDKPPEAQRQQDQRARAALAEEEMPPCPCRHSESGQINN